MTQITKAEKRIHIEIYSCFLSGHIIPMLKVAEILQEQNPHFDVVFYTGPMFLNKFKGNFPKVKMVEIDDNFTQIDYERAIQGSHESLQQAATFYLSDFFASKAYKPDLIISDFFVLQAFRWAKKNEVKCIMNVPNSYSSMYILFSCMDFNRSYNFQGFTIFQTLPKVSIFSFFEELYDEIRFNNRIIVDSYIGLDEPALIPSNHTLIGILSNRSDFPNEIGEELRTWMQAWKDKGKNKFMYVSFGSILNISNQLTLNIARVIEKLQYPTIWSLRSQNRSQIVSQYIFHREWFPQEAILNQPEVRAYLSHCGWGSITEAVSTKTLLVCAPIFADQQTNANIIVKKHIGVKVYESPINQIKLMLDIKIDDSTLYQGIRKIMEDDSYVEAMEKVHKLSKTYDTPKLLSKVVNETLEFGIEHLINPAYERTSVKSDIGTTIKDIIAEKWWPSLEKKP